MVLMSDLAAQRSINYLNVKLTGMTSNRSGVGAIVTLTAGGRTYVKLHDGKSDYLSQSFYPLYFGLGDRDTVDQVQVRWPSGNTQTITGPISANTRLEVTEE